MGLPGLLSAASGLLWGPLTGLLLGTGFYFSCRLGFFQLRRPGLVVRETVFSLFPRKKDKKAAGLSPLQAMSTALAAAIGTGNVAGVAAAITLGGPGAVFWMWVSALLGMMTGFSENLLGALYQRRGPDGTPLGGPMYYLRDGLSKRKGLRPLAKPLSLLFALSCALASFGIGNLSQVNAIAASLESAFQVPPPVTGLAVAALAGPVVFGGVKRVGKAAEKLVPIMALGYIAACLAAIFCNLRAQPAVFRDILAGAFGFRAAAGGFSGAALRAALSAGVRRGLFSNEAGLGSTVMAHAAAPGDRPLRQGLWSIFEVFFDTIVICSLTALMLLSSGVCGSVDPAGNMVDGAPLVQLAFARTFHSAAGAVLGGAVALFAFGTLLGWSHYGAAAVRCALGDRAVPVYRALFVLCVIPGACLRLELVWQLSDLFNGLMALPNLFGILALSGEVIHFTKEERLWKS